MATFGKAERDGLHVFSISGMSRGCTVKSFDRAGPWELAVRRLAESGSRFVRKMIFADDALVSTSLLHRTKPFLSQLMRSALDIRRCRQGGDLIGTEPLAEFLDRRGVDRDRVGVLVVHPAGMAPRASPGPQRNHGLADQRPGHDLRRDYWLHAVRRLVSNSRPPNRMPNPRPVA